MTAQPLGIAGTAFLESYLAEIDGNDAAGSALLESVCRTIDDIAALENGIQIHGHFTAGSKGQLVLNPAIAQVDKMRTTLGRLLGQLQKEGDVAKKDTRSYSQKMSEAAKKSHYGRSRGLAK